jgi:hypothetical protein
MSKQVLLIGGASAGKTHFGAQLLARLMTRKGALKFYESPTNVSLFETTLQRLGQGLSSDHTASGIYGEVVLPVETESGERMDLVWPDYAGEQIENIAQLRSLTSHWTARIVASERWILMVRLMLASTEEDLLNRPLYDDVLNNRTAERPTSISKQSHIVELLQILRHVRGLGNLHRTLEPRLLVLLSCWDELGGNRKGPVEEFASRVPLVNAYIRSTWSKDALTIYGLSALGKALSDDTVDVEYQNRGPESFGYVVTDAGKQLSDLTMPIADLAK